MPRAPLVAVLTDFAYRCFGPFGSTPAVDRLGLPGLGSDLPLESTYSPNHPFYSSTNALSGFYVFTHIQMSGSGRTAMIAARKLISDKFSDSPLEAVRLRSDHGSSAVSVSIDSGGTMADLADPGSVLTAIEAIVKGAGFPFSAPKAVDFLTDRALRLTGDRCYPHGSPTAHTRAGWPAHLEGLRGQWGPLFDRWLFDGRERSIGVSDPHAVWELHFGLPPLETVVAREVARNTGSAFPAPIEYTGLLALWPRVRVLEAAQSLVETGFLRDLRPAQSGLDLFEVARGRKLSHVPRAWVMEL
jgi:hypothetical protein